MDFMLNPLLDSQNLQANWKNSEGEMSSLSLFIYLLLPSLSSLYFLSHNICPSPSAYSALPFFFQLSFISYSSHSFLLTRFLTEPFFGQFEPRIKPVTAGVYLKRLKTMLGWYIQIRLANSTSFSCSSSSPPSSSTTSISSSNSTPTSSPDENEIEWENYSNVGLKDIVPSHLKGGAAVAFDYVQWLKRERQIAASTVGEVLKMIIQIAKVSILASPPSLLFTLSPLVSSPLSPKLTISPSFHLSSSTVRITRHLLLLTQTKMSQTLSSPFLL
jgi:hypothetical protein